MGDINFDIAAAVLIALDVFIFYYRPRPRGVQSASFSVLLWASLASTLMDILTALMNASAAAFPRWALYAANGSFYAFQNSLPILFAFFTVGLTDHWRTMGKAERVLFVLPWAAAILLILTTPLSGWIFGYLPDRSYRRGPGLPALYLIALFYVLYGVRLSLSYRGVLPSRILNPLLAFILFSFVPIAIQFFFPRLLLQCLGVAAFEFFILLTVQNPDEYIETDSGLLSRNGLSWRLALAGRNGKELSVLLLSVENASFLKHGMGFESYERMMGEVARELALRAQFRGGRASHLGDARFALTLPLGVDFQDAVRSLQERFRQPWSASGESVNLSARFCALAFPAEANDAAAVFQASELLETGAFPGPRGRILAYRDLGMADGKRLAQVELAIDRGLSAGGFYVCYQPIWSVAEKRIVSAEALVRLTDAQLGPVFPDEFIPLAERRGSIGDIDSFVLDSSCAFLSGNGLVEKGTLHYVEVNLSVAECASEAIVDRIRTAVERGGLEPRAICLEVTETAAAESPGALARNLKALSREGFALALDDYGSGYSNINYLAELPFNYVKFDMGMVQAAFKTVRGRFTLEGSVAMCRRMGLATIAEGVETAAQAAELESLGCDFLQGYHFSKPVPGADFLALIGGGAR